MKEGEKRRYIGFQKAKLLDQGQIQIKIKEQYTQRKVLDEVRIK